MGAVEKHGKLSSKSRKLSSSLGENTQRICTDPSVVPSASIPHTSELTLTHLNTHSPSHHHEIGTYLHHAASQRHSSICRILQGGLHVLHPDSHIQGYLYIPRPQSPPLVISTNNGSARLY